MNNKRREFAKLNTLNRFGEVNVLNLDLVETAIKKINFKYFVLILVFVTSGIFASHIFSAWGILPIAFAITYFAADIIEREQRKTRVIFQAEYPNYLLAVASALKAGMAPLNALERAAVSLDSNSYLKQEVEKLLSALKTGQKRENAFLNFCKDYKSPDVQLFREACLIALDFGGRFSSSLAKMAETSRARSNLILAARVATTNMRMTATILLAITPLLLFFTSKQTNQFWTIFIDDPITNSIATFGVCLIACSVAILKRMSSFKP